MHIKKNDNVIVLTGKDKGKKGKVLRVFPTANRVLIESVNIQKKSQRGKKKGEKGTMVEIAMPIHASNVKKTS